jgi:mono/diheme cytochrome c family protein
MLGLNLPVVGGIALVMLLLRWRKVGMLTWVFAWFLGMLVFLEFGFQVPIPGSVVTLYMGIVGAALFAYVTSSPERKEQVVTPILRLVLEPRLRLLLLGVLVLVPLLAALNVYAKMNVPLEAPAFGRTVHPAPPESISVHDNDIDLVVGDNPYRGLEESDPAAFGQHLENGRRVYFENCFYCHGDAMAGDGMFAHGLNPIPTNFTDQGVLPMLQESFLMWRIAKGGPGLPEEGGPWDSAMPAWENFLTEEEMWDVILFLYDYTDYRPRALHEVH